MAHPFANFAYMSTLSLLIIVFLENLRKTASEANRRQYELTRAALKHRPRPLDELGDSSETARSPT